MSGPDIIVGLVFGALPLIFKAVEGYEKISDVIATYRKYSDEAARFSTELSTQKVIFYNECKLLLREIVDDQRLLHEMFSHSVSGGGSKHEICQSLKDDENLDRKLFERINAGSNNSYKELVELLRLIDQDLQEIYEETKYFVDSRPTVSAQPSPLSLSASMLKTGFPSHRRTPTRSKNGSAAFVRNFASRLRKRYYKKRFVA